MKSMRGLPKDASSRTPLNLPKPYVLGSQTDPTDRRLGQLYDDSHELTKDLIQVYRRLYDLPVVHYSDNDLTEEGFEYCKQRSVFVVVLPYTADGKVFLSRVFYDKKVGWLLPGGSIRVDRHESIQDAAIRQFRRAICTGTDLNLLSSISLGELDPVAYIENTFRRGDETAKHVGIGFIGRIRVTGATPDRFDRNPLVKGSFLDHLHPVALAQYGNEQVYKCGLERLKGIDRTAVPESEITEKPSQFRLAVHRHIVKPLFRVFGHLVGRDPVNRINERILESIQSASHCDTFLDASCGDNPLVYDVARNVPVCIINDVSWELVDELMQRRSSLRPPLPKDRLIVPTNHDISMLPFAEKVFDVSLCKNTLHHMGGCKKARGLLKSLERVTRRRIILVEIMDPRHEPWWARQRHRYYMKWLKEDVQQSFYSREDFQNVVMQFLGGHSVRFDEVDTLRGVYLYAVIDLE